MLNNHRTVLLIDDNDVDLKINSKIIKISNLFDEIVVCQSGDEGLAYLNRAMSDGKKLPDFILLDIQMPDMDGFEFLEFYKKLPKKLTEKCLIAMLSSTLDFGDIKKAEASLHVVKLLKKPLFPKELEDLLKKYFSS
ncbi:response regulator [Pedobacter africanus]|uniref:CheY chemotaxis protein or a CheY-like REC (Receiver) domain n=1 Tax=Pedobacter africanus TaxID=151894 RepID=A0A1W2E0F1_9SPHI|nr:response regulator [Pedobacter africanus]SMD03311.1 CheY chemotaxis protein or a CheY-like REC (receiver) domain [Pedobacter africanus]